MLRNRRNVKTSLITFTFYFLLLNGEQQRSTNRRNRIAGKEIKNDFSFRAFLCTTAHHTQQRRAEMLFWEESIHNWNRKTEEQGKENEWAYIEVGYNIIMFTSILLVDQSWRYKLLFNTQRYGKYRTWIWESANTISAVISAFSWHSRPTTADW